MDERDIRWKSDKMVGADDGSANPPWWLTKTHEYRLAKLPINHPTMVKRISVRSKQSSEMKGT
jgi:hypothetical protein